MPEEPKAGGEAQGSIGTGAPKIPLSKDGPSLRDQLGSIVHDPAEGIFGQKDFKGVFDQTVKTVTGKNQYEIDRAELDFKMLQPVNIAEALAMAGIKAGVHQHRIRGDSVYHFDKNRFRFVDEGDYLIVKGKQKEQIQGPATLAYLNDRTVVVGRDDDLSVAAEQTTFVVGKSTAQYVGKHEMTAPENFEWKQVERTFSATATELKTVGFGLLGTTLEATALATEGQIAKFEGKVFHEKAKGHEGTALALRDEAIPMEPVLIMRVNILVQVCIITPFG